MFFVDNVSARHGAQDEGAKRSANARADPYGYATTGEEPKQGLQVNPYAIFMQFFRITGPDRTSNLDRQHYLGCRAGPCADPH